jgi:hypothetical protein
MPLIVLRVRSAKPASTFVAEHRGGFIARFIEMRDGFAGGLWFLARIFPGCLCFHDDTPCRYCTPGGLLSSLSQLPSSSHAGLGGCSNIVLSGVHSYATE